MKKRQVSRDKKVISEFLYNCLSKEEQENFTRSLKEADMSKPPLIVYPEIKNNSYRDCFEVKLKILPGSIGLKRPKVVTEDGTEVKMGSFTA